MISKELKDILESAGGRFIIVEDGQPRYIIMSFQDYKNDILAKKSIETLTEKELVAKINSDISFWRENRAGDEEQLKSDIEKLEDIEYI